MSAAVAPKRIVKERVRRTRSRGRNELAPLRVSQIAAHEYDLAPACISLVCPSCRTWVPINRPNGQPGRTRLVPHHTEKAGTADPTFCKGGSHRRVIIDVEVERWRRRLEEGISETDGRRTNRVTRKPKMAPAPAVSQIAAQKQTATADDEPGDGRALWLLREMKWASTETAVRATDTRRAERPAGDAPTESPAVPLTTLRPQRPVR
ncbi:hypothetical protein [Streptomyces netropsis]|uniref:Uncharacterized protein n=1 Tax=Streptomyces netropsis TaxID=55404 RepID=A0A7W7PJ63_STRNE|nr:hypothetical protein [Streptomyces netropsis]MBB4890450.1 hypothetical protein [Streptomyces netropsis]GGR45842.1 hypothetical protein GCM10010219_59270 [Streptomyces netropsis]